MLRDAFSFEYRPRFYLGTDTTLGARIPVDNHNGKVGGRTELRNALKNEMDEPAPLYSSFLRVLSSLPTCIFNIELRVLLSSPVFPCLFISSPGSFPDTRVRIKFTGSGPRNY